MHSTHASQNGRLEALQAKHSALQHQINEELKHAARASELINRLKREKLKLKEEIERERRRA